MELLLPLPVLLVVLLLMLVLQEQWHVAAAEQRRQETCEDRTFHGDGASHLLAAVG